ncbi:MAG: SDR family oxidoreductase [Planctomycetes bacterium]|nr:SDR family oxidoreductase [Planctomycetota bacterium]
MYKCLVTGGGGFIGSHLVEFLVGSGHSVRVLDDFSTGNPVNLQGLTARVELLKGSVTDLALLERATAGCDVVYHLAAVPSVTKSVEDPLLVHEICATGTLRLLDAARRSGVRRVVFAASSSAYGDQPGDLRKESDPLIPLSPYAAAKLAGEHYCSCFTAVYGLETVRLRFFNVFGPRQDAKSPYSGVIALFISAMTQDRRPTVHGDGLQARDFVYVADVVQSMVKAAQAPKASGQVYNIGLGRSTSVLDLVRELNAILGTQLEPIHAPPRAGDVRMSQADINLARNELDYDPKFSFQEGLRRTLAAQK